MEEFLKNLVIKYQLPFKKGEFGGWQIELPLRGKFMCKLDIGDKAFEWYAAVHRQQDDRQVWMDWMDYYGYGSESEEELIDDKKRDLTYFIDIWLSAIDVRTNGFFRPLRKLELNLSGTWIKDSMYDPNR